MSSGVEQIIHVLAVLVVLGQVTAVVLVVGLFPTPLRAWLRKILPGSRALVLAYAVSFMAITGSLFFSEIAHLEPCELCWFQRILMYPQVILLLLALLKKNRDAWLQSLVLSIIGTGISVYHIAVQFGAPLALPCSAVGQAGSCTQVQIKEFGFLTIPGMALTGFLLLILLSLYYRQRTTATSLIE